MKKYLLSLLLFVSSFAFGGSVTGQIQTATQGPIPSGTLTFTLTQAAVQVGSATIVTSPVNCYTDRAAGNIVGEPDPLVAPTVTTNTSSGTLPAGTYFTVFTYYDASGTSVGSFETTTLLSSTGTLIVTPPVLQPANATGWKIFISTTSGAETLQSTQVGFSSTYQQSSALVAGSALPSSNTSVCKLLFNDQLIPSFTGYKVGFVNSSGSNVSGFPQKWYLSGGAAGTINVSSGTPNYSSVVVYPQAILATPTANAPQSINGPLSLGAFQLTAGAGVFSGPISAPNLPVISGTANKLTKFTSSSAIGNSSASDDGTTFTIPEALTSKNENGKAIIHVDQYASWSAALADCPAIGCTLDGRSPNTPLAIGTLDPGTAAVTILLGNNLYTVDHIVMQAGLRINGSGILGNQGTQITAVGTSAPFITPTSATLKSIQGVVLQDFVLFCTSGNSAQDGILADISAASLPSGSVFEAYNMSRITISGCKGSAMHFKGPVAAVDRLPQLGKTSYVTVISPSGNTTVGACLRIEGAAGQMYFENFNCGGASSTAGTGIYIGVTNNSDAVGPYSIWFEGLTDQLFGTAVNLSGCTQCTFHNTHFEVDSIGFQGNTPDGSVTNNDIVLDVGQANGNVAVNAGNGVFLDVSSASNNLGSGWSVKGWNFSGTPDKFCKGGQGANVNFVDNRYASGAPVTTGCGAIGVSTSSTTLVTNDYHFVFLNSCTGGTISTLTSGLGPNEVLTIESNATCSLSSAGNMILGSTGTTLNVVAGDTLQFINSDQTGTNTWYLLNQPKPTATFTLGCSGTATAATTLALTAFGGPCTNATNANFPSSAGQMRNLRVKCLTGGVNSSSGVFTLRQNGTNTTSTCTTGTGTTCSDTTHVVTGATGDLWHVAFTTQTADTLANCSVSWDRF